MNESARFRHTRDAHRFEIAEDYVEAILDLIDLDGDATLTELAKRFGVTHPTVFKTLRRLEGEELVLLRPYRSIRLTEKGHSLALQCRKRHEIVVTFLKALGLDGETAEIDSEGIEHHVSKRTLAVMQEEFVDGNEFKENPRNSSNVDGCQKSLLPERSS